MKVKCPNCEKPFEILSDGELRDLGIAPNVRARAYAKGQFPEPWAHFPNRDLWLKDEVLDYLTEQTLRQTRAFIDPVLDRIYRMPKDSQPEALRVLREELDRIEENSEPEQPKGGRKKR